MITEEEIVLLGNHQDLQDFKKNFNPHDRNTLEFYFRMSKKKESVLIVRRVARHAMQMCAIVVPLKMVASKGGFKESLKGRIFPQMGRLQALPVGPNQIFVFGEHIQKNEANAFQSFLPEKKKRKPFEARI